jgi:DNA-binding NarL/FixJ family response regulator
MEPGSDPPISVVIVDGHALVAEALEATLTALPDVHVEAVAGTLAAALPTVEAVQPDVVILDTGLADGHRNGNGAGGTAGVLSRSPATKVLIVSAHASIDVVASAIEAGAVGVVAKTENLEELLTAVRRAGRGGMVLPPGRLHEVATLLRTRPPPVGSELTGREREVPTPLSRGTNPDAIAHGLGVSTHTVRNHVRAVRRKLGASSQLEAVAIAYRAGLVDPAID